MMVWPNKLKAIMLLEMLREIVQILVSIYILQKQRLVNSKFTFKLKIYINS